MAHAISTVTGIAISPLLGTGAYGAYQWFAADETQRAALPWYAQPKFWIPALLIVAVCATKDSLGAALPPVFKKPLDIIEVAENKFSGLVAAGAVVPFAMDAFTKILVDSARAEAVTSGGLAMIPSLALSWAPFLNILTVPLGVAIFLIVWMGSHAINVLILLSPWGAIDSALKGARTALLGLITITATMNPWLAAGLSLLVLLFAYLIAGWAFRLTIFGAIMSWEFFTGRRHRFAPAANQNRLFSGAGFAGVPVRTYGALNRREDGSLEFTFRPWLVMKPRTVAVPAPAPEIVVGTGLFFSVVIRKSGSTLFLLPPRYRGHEQALVDAYNLSGVQPAGLLKAWSSLKEMIGGKAAPKELPAPAAVA